MEPHPIIDAFYLQERLVVYCGVCLDLLRTIPDGAIHLVVTSPPYNIGKAYERRLDLDVYLTQQARVIHECARVLAPSGSL